MITGIFKMNFKFYFILFTLFPASNIISQAQEEPISQKNYLLQYFLPNGKREAIKSPEQWEKKESRFY